MAGLDLGSRNPRTFGAQAGGGIKRSLTPRSIHGTLDESRVISHLSLAHTSYFRRLSIVGRGRHAAGRQPVLSRARRRAALLVPGVQPPGEAGRRMVQTQRSEDTDIHTPA